MDVLAKPIRPIWTIGPEVGAEKSTVYGGPTVRTGLFRNLHGERTMRHVDHKRFITALLFLALLTSKTTLFGDDGTTRTHIRDMLEVPSTGRGLVVPAAFDDVEEVDEYYRLAQTQPDDETTAEPRPTPSRSEQLAARRRQTATRRLPSMFGDFYGGSTVQASIQQPSISIPQTFVDNAGGIDFFVTNRNGGDGADFNPAVPIDVHNGGPNGVIITSSIGPYDPMAQPIYPISDPGAFFPPPTTGPGTIVYQGGTAFFAGQNAGGSDTPFGSGDGWGIQFSHLFTPTPVLVNLPAGGGAVRRVKVAENNSPIPRNRFIFNYNYFNQVSGGVGNVNRYSAGMEQTFFGGRSSVEVLVPMASTLDVDQIAGGIRSTDTQFGDLSLIFKTLLVESDDFVIAGGIGLAVPTASDARVFNTSGQQIIDLEHQSTHLLPYLGMVHNYDSGLYWQSFVQLDIDLNGNPISADLTGQNLQSAGVLQDQTLMFVDFGLGYWLRNLGEGSLAVAATAEMHWAGTLQDADIVKAGNLNITSLVNRYDVLNLTLGASILVNDRFTLRPAFVIPLNDKQFDYEAIMQVNVWR